ncbi:MAG: DUF748 domain-containing protein [Magnetococcales bacterium]|nr:DUF748 domain-containing protein [Magnetococcales bacterium]NGZ25348.1 DUF748 domain-containing protein [Magnetococcales bacterium]
MALNRPWLLWSTSLLAAGIVLLLWVGVALVQVEQYLPRIIQLLQQVTNREVRVESLSISLAEGLLLDLAGVEIRSRDEKLPPLLTAKHVLVGVGLEYFLRRQLTLSSITLVTPQFNLVRFADGAALLREAHETALAGDKVLAEQVGTAISQFHVGRLTIRDGLINLADWGSQNDQTLVVDKVQANLYHISPAAPSPINATARFHSIPFKVNGQVGPLPASLHPDAMPVILSFEAKTIPLAAIADWLPKGVEGERGYFSALVQGSLRDGLATSSWLEVEKLTLPNQEGTREPVTLAIRQKSLLRPGAEPQDLQIQEFYSYINGSPWLKVEGGLGIWPLRHLDVALTTLRPIPLHGWQDAQWGKWDGQAEGVLTLFGHPYDWLEVRGEVDITDGGWSWVGMNKAIGKPFKLFPHLFRQRDGWKIYGLQFMGEDELELSGHLQGVLAPQPDLTLHMQGKWEAMADLFPATVHWPLTGGRWWGEGHFTATEGEGQVVAENFHWGEKGVLQATFPFLRQEEGWLFSPLSLQFDPVGLLYASLSVQPENYQAMLTLQNLPLADIPDLSQGPGLHRRFDGPLSLNGDVNGRLDSHGFPQWPEGGRLQAWVNPGGMLGIGNGVLTHRPQKEVTLSQAGKTFYWEEAMVELLLTPAGVRINQLAMDTGQAKITGTGWVERGQGLDMRLQIHAPWWQDDPNLSAQLFGTLDDVRLKPVIP